MPQVRGKRGLLGQPAQGPAVRRADAVEAPGLHGRRGPVAGPGYRDQHVDIQRGECRPPGSHPRPRARASGGDLHQPGGRHALPHHVLPRLPRSSVFRGGPSGAHGPRHGARALSSRRGQGRAGHGRGRERQLFRRARRSAPARPDLRAGREPHRADPSGGHREPRLLAASSRGQPGCAGPDHRAQRGRLHRRRRGPGRVHGDHPGSRPRVLDPAHDGGEAELQRHPVAEPVARQHAPRATGHAVAVRQGPAGAGTHRGGGACPAGNRGGAPGPRVSGRGQGPEGHPPARRRGPAPPDGRRHARPRGRVPHGGGGPRPAHRLRQRGQHASRPGTGAAARDRGAAGHRRGAGPDRAAAPGREPGPGRSRGHGGARHSTLDEPPPGRVPARSADSPRLQLRPRRPRAPLRDARVRGHDPSLRPRPRPPGLAARPRAGPPRGACGHGLTPQVPAARRPRDRPARPLPGPPRGGRARAARPRAGPRDSSRLRPRPPGRAVVQPQDERLHDRSRPRPSRDGSPSACRGSPGSRRCPW